MSEITPEMIAEMATKLYRQLPGEGATDYAPALPQGFTPSHDVSPRAGMAHAPTQAVAPMTVPQENTGYHDGLANFVRQIQLSHSGSSPGECAIGSPMQGFPSSGGPIFAPTGVIPRPFDVNQIRRDFPVLNQRIHGKPLVWFDNAATTQKPNSVIQAISNFYSNDNSNIHRGAHTLAALARPMLMKRLVTRSRISSARVARRKLSSFAARLKASTSSLKPTGEVSPKRR